MFWVGGASLAIIFLSAKAYINNRDKWSDSSYSRSSSKLFYLFRQGSAVILILAGAMIFMLTIVCYFKGFQIHLSSEMPFHLDVITNS